MRGLPSVFNLGKNPWIDADGAPAREIAAQVERCLSRSLSFELLKKAD
ncbi:MAG: (4Fe-4S)-binding protein [Methylocapsa sp.]|nr:(4Fe-4S)-binding protein [Methylocapsa sp.]